MIHEGLLHVQGDGAGGYLFLGGDGQAVEYSQAVTPGPGAAHTCARRLRSGTPDSTGLPEEKLG